MRVIVRHPGTDAATDPPGSGEIHVWRFGFDAAADDPHLTDDERERADRYRLPRIRTQFAVGRGFLRSTLGWYLGCPPRLVPLTREAGGKPVLDPAAGCDLHFNLSHSGDVGLLAVARRPVGIDVEVIREVPNAAGLVDRFFAAAEREAFARLPAECRMGGFFRGWTCKEALLKAVGRGIGDLDGCVVELDPRAEPRVIRFDPGEWRLAVWEPDGGYVAAVAVESATPIHVG